MLPKTFANKIFLSILLTCTVSLLIVCSLIYKSWADRNREEFVRRYETLATELATTITLVETATDKLMLSAARHLSYLIAREGIPSNEKLEQLAIEYGVSDFFITNKQGDFTRWTHAQQLPKSILTFCPDYTRFLSDGTQVEQTPVIYSPQGASKFTVIPLNKDGGGIIESGMRVNYLGEALEKAARADGNTLSLGLFTPSGQSLGFFATAGTDDSNKSRIPDVLEKGGGHTIGETESVFYSKVNSNCDSCCECKEKNSVDAAGRYYYVLKATVSSKPLLASNKNLRTNIFLIFIGVFIAVFFLSRHLSNLLVRRMNRITETLTTINQTKNLSIRIADTSQDEIGILSRAFDAMTENLATAQQELIRRELDRGIAESARQVAHDIRSPLSALEVGYQSLEDVPDDVGQIMRIAFNRIKDIANKMAPIAGGHREDDKSHCCLITSLVESVVTEKRLQYRQCGDISLDLELTKDPFVFVEVEPQAFKRSLSNLIDNSFEAIRGPGKVIVSIKATPHKLSLRIADSGRGIPKELITQVGTQGATFGKPNGSGLGLSYAKSKIKEWGGKFRIRSIVNTGTLVSMELPRIQAPAYFATELNFNSVRTVIIVDDDASMHEAWRKVLAEPVRKNLISIIDCYTPGQLRSALMRDPKLRSEGLFLIDYHYVKHTENGLDLSISMGIQKQSILVTSYAEEPAVIERCIANNVRLLPKSLIYCIPVQAVARENRAVSIVLVDNDPLVGASWEMYCKRKNRKFLALTDESKLGAMEGLPRDSVFFIDLNLCNWNKTSFEIANALSEKGYRNLYLATGSTDNLPEWPFLKGIVGKEPPPWLFGANLS